MIKVHQKWVRSLSYSGITLVMGISVGLSFFQSMVNQQGNDHSLSPNEVKSDSRVVEDYIKKTNLVMAKSRLSQENLGRTQNQVTENQQKSSDDKQSEKEGDPTKVEKVVVAESNPVIEIKTNLKTSSEDNRLQENTPAKTTIVDAGEPKGSLQVSRGSSVVDNLMKRALSLEGIPYLWGGTTRDGFDCSGFVQYVFKASGISLPRTSYEQYKLGTPVSRDQLKPGDLVFFSTYQSGASDVRIFIGGGRTIGSASDGVAIHSLSESYWSKHYLGARRVL